MTSRVAHLLGQPEEDWRYTIQWPAATSSLLRPDVLKAKALAAAVVMPKSSARRKRLDAYHSRGCSGIVRCVSILEVVLREHVDNVLA